MNFSQAQSICRRCSGTVIASHSNEVKKSIEMLDRVQKLPGKTKRLIQGGLWGLTGVLFFLAAYMSIHYELRFLFLPAVAALVGSFISIRLLKPGAKNLTKILTSQVITSAQLETVLRLHDGTVTAKQLASATSTPEDIAKDYLKSLAIEGKLSPVIDSDATELTYTKTFLLP
ncbi:hypothetical protein FACS1894164_10940 [Spirochaetia bacterium]|nr:hypothetical protein FACS1894164_10940 [Spirochaetia bacterium]